jgi:hypothetical protein
MYDNVLIGVKGDEDEAGAFTRDASVPDTLRNAGSPGVQRRPETRCCGAR